MILTTSLLTSWIALSTTMMMPSVFAEVGTSGDDDIESDWGDDFNTGDNQRKIGEGGDDTIKSGEGDDWNIGDNIAWSNGDLGKGGDDKIKSGKGNDINCGDGKARGLKLKIY